VTDLFLGVAVAIGVLIAANVHRVAVGPTIHDRLVGVNVVGVNAMLLLVLFGVVFDRLDMFIDLAIVYALLSFVSLIAVGKYLERSRRGRP
jgi:multicomponent Na+:H+ antiporter subunit F